MRRWRCVVGDQEHRASVIRKNLHAEAQRELDAPTRARQQPTSNTDGYPFPPNS